jgi:hypothetical protein
MPGQNVKAISKKEAPKTICGNSINGKRINVIVACSPYM